MRYTLDGEMKTVEGLTIEFLPQAMADECEFPFFHLVNPRDPDRSGRKARAASA